MALYLEQIVKPIYAHVFSETFSGLKNGRPQPRSAIDAKSAHPLNYDDWNEAFWSLESLNTLQTVGGAALLGTPPGERWQLLVEGRVDWKRFMDSSAKTHREVRRR